MKKLHSVIFFLILGVTAYSQEVVNDSLGIISVGDTLYQIYSEIEFDDGSKQIGLGVLLDSASMTNHLQNLIVDGGELPGGRKTEGSRKLTRAYRKVLLANQSEQERTELEGLYETVSGGDFDTSFTHFDDYFVDTWRLVGPDSTVTLEVARANNGKLRAKYKIGNETILNGFFDVKDEGRIELRNLGNGYPSPIVLIRRKQNRNRFQNLDKTYILRP